MGAKIFPLLDIHYAVLLQSSTNLCVLFVLFLSSFKFSFYVAAPLSLCNCAPEVFKFGLGLVAELAIRSNNQMPSSEFDWWGSLNPLLNLGWSQWIGAATFFWGWIHQRRCHAILVSVTCCCHQLLKYITYEP